MLATHIFDDPKIDAQHEVIYSHLEYLQKALLDKNSQQPIQSALQHLHDLLVTHFETEESFMNEHRQTHRDILDLLDRCLAVAPATGEVEPSLAEAISKLTASLKSHEFRNPDIAW